MPSKDPLSDDGHLPRLLKESLGLMIQPKWGVSTCCFYDRRWQQWVGGLNRYRGRGGAPIRARL